MKKNGKVRRGLTAWLLTVVVLCQTVPIYAAEGVDREPGQAGTKEGRDRPEAAGEGLIGGMSAPADSVLEAADTTGVEYRSYLQRLNDVEHISELTDYGFEAIEDQIFQVTLENFGEVMFLPALDGRYRRLALFLAGEDGNIVYRTEQLETNYRVRGSMKQETKGIAGVSFQDVNGDGLTDILLITVCAGMGDTAQERTGRVGDVLFQEPEGFYRDWRLSDKINRFGMSKSLKLMMAFVKDGDSTEFLYTAVTLEELLSHGFEIITEQCYWRSFEKAGRLRVVPGTFRMAGYDVFLIYLVNEQGNIVWSFQPMEDYDNLYALRGVTCRDIDGDGLKDIVVLARYSAEDDRGGMKVESDYEIYYQRTDGFDTDTGFKKSYRCGEEETMEEIVRKARAWWGWSAGEYTDD